MSSDDGWEEVFENDAELKIDTKTLVSKQDKVIQCVRAILKIFKDLLQPFESPIIDETIDYNIKRKLMNYFMCKDDITDYDKNIKLFKSLKYYNIHSRLYFVMDNKLSTFLEFCINNEIIENAKKWGGFVFYIDSHFEFDDYSWHFSRATKNHSIFQNILQRIKKLRIKDPSKIEPFVKLDEKRLKILPSSLSKFSKHPLYVLQSQLAFNRTVFPRRPVFGYFKGEPIFPRKNIITLKTQNQYYRLGKEIKDKRPYKTHKDIKLYSEFQVKDIELEDMGDKRTLDYFHDNHIPKKCVFIDNEHAEQVCKTLNIEHRICFRGFDRGCPIYSGVVVYKTDLLLLSIFLFEYSENVRRLEENEIKFQSAINWRKIFKTVVKFLEIRKKLGLSDEQYDEI